MQKLSGKNLLLVGFTLFSMFFGAGNLIFPPHLGAQAGTSLWPAFAGLAVSVLMNILANRISQLLEGAGLNGDANTADLLAMTPVQALTMFVSVVLVAPVTEEFAFRSVTTAVMAPLG